MTKAGNPASNPYQQPELTLWRAALLKLVTDAQYHVIGRTKSRTDREEQQAAFNDLCACGLMTRRLCAFTGYDPDWLSEKFRKYVQNYYGKE